MEAYPDNMPISAAVNGRHNVADLPLRASNADKSNEYLFHAI